MNKQSYKSCSMCSTVWETENDFLSDPQVKLAGYQMNPVHLDKGLILFNHLNCQSTISKRVGDFSHLYRGPRYDEKLTGSESCPSYCLNKNELRQCPAKCECAYVREILTILRNWDK